MFIIVNEKSRPAEDSQDWKVNRFAEERHWMVGLWLAEWKKDGVAAESQERFTSFFQLNSKIIMWYHLAHFCEAVPLSFCSTPYCALAQNVHTYSTTFSSFLEKGCPYSKKITWSKFSVQLIRWRGLHFVALFNFKSHDWNNRFQTTEP